MQWLWPTVAVAGIGLLLFFGGMALLVAFACAVSQWLARAELARHGVAAGSRAVAPATEAGQNLMASRGIGRRGKTAARHAAMPADVRRKLAA